MERYTVRCQRGSCEEAATFCGREPVLRKRCDALAPAAQARCEKGDSDGCLAVASLAEHGMPAGLEPDRVDTLYDQACAAGSKGACRRNARLRLKKTMAAAPTHEKAQAIGCDAGEVEYCRNLAVYELQDGKDAARGVAAVRRACELDDGAACAKLGLWLATGFPRGGVKRNIDESLAMLDRSCAMGAGAGCTEIGRYVAAGRSDPGDPLLTRAITYLERACDRSDREGCVWWAQMLAEGRGRKSDGDKAFHILELGCRSAYLSDTGFVKDVSRSLGCLRAADMLAEGRFVKKNWTEAKQMVERTCGKAADDAACRDMAPAILAKCAEEEARHAAAQRAHDSEPSHVARTLAKLFPTAGTTWVECADEPAAISLDDGAISVYPGHGAQEALQYPVLAVAYEAEPGIFAITCRDAFLDDEENEFIVELGRSTSIAQWQAGLERFHTETTQYVPEEGWYYGTRRPSGCH